MTATARASSAIAATVEFLEATQDAGDANTIGSLFDTVILALGFGHYSLRCAPQRPSVGSGGGRIWTYPRAWEEHFDASGYAALSPVIQMAGRVYRPFNWFEVLAQPNLSAAQRRIYSEATEFSIGMALTVPIHQAEGPPSIIIINADSSLDPTADVIRAEGKKAHLLGLALYERISPQLGDQWIAVREPGLANTAANDNCMADRSAAPIEMRHQLSPFERECLVWAAFQIDDAAIAARFSLPETMVRQALEIARIKLGASSREHAVVRALAHGLIAL